MTSSASSASSRAGSSKRSLRAALPILLFVGAFALYASTAAPGTIFGDPSEYQFIPAVLGVAHPPGYAFYTLLAKLWQLFVPLGTVAFRTNLLSSAVGAWVVTAVYMLVRDTQIGLEKKGISGDGDGRSIILGSPFSLVAPLFAGLALGAAPDLWQHAIHANAHIVSAALAVTHLWLLTRWWRTGEDRWLALFAAALGLAVTHHPITLMGVPAYGLFILAVRPRIVLEWRTLLPLAGCLLLGLSPLLYYPLRSPSAPFGPTDMNTWDGFVRHMTARGLRVNLFHFGLSDQPDRALVFWSLLRLQFLLPVILLIPVGLITLVRRGRRLALLMGVFLLGHLAFTLNTVQDVMAYLLLPFSALAAVAGVGAWTLMSWVNGEDLLSGLRVGGSGDAGPRAVIWRVLLVGVLLPWPIARGLQNVSRGISLRDFSAAEEWVDAVHRRFSGRGEGAALLAPWEFLTPLWVHAYTEGDALDEADVRLEYVSAALPWAEAVWSHIEEGPVYLGDFRPSIRRAGFRMVPEGTFYRVEPPPVKEAQPSQSLNVWADERIQILGYDLRNTTVRAGETLELVLYQSVEQAMEGIWMPYAQLGPVESRWTTDSRLLTSQWEPGEVVVERYELLVPFHLPPGDYPLELGYADLTGGRAEVPLSNGAATADLESITVLPGGRVPSTETLEAALANLDNQVGLMEARARAGAGHRRDRWRDPLVVKAGRSLHLTLVWRALASPRDSATVFIHLIDAAGRPVAGWDYTPLGGSAPTYLWFPKWLPGQTFTDPYRLALPPDLPSGDYRLEVGMYGMTSQRRFPVVDLSGDLAGDRVILGPIRVE